MTLVLKRPAAALTLSVVLSAVGALAFAPLNLAHARTSQQQTEVVIKRDEFGMPHVYASTVGALFYGYGYAVAEDRLFQMEMARRSTQGQVAEVLGEKFVAFDKSIRGNFTPDRIRAQIAALAPKERDVLEGYAAGMNGWIDKVLAEPDNLMPKEFNDNGFKPVRWNAYDVAMVFVGTMANRFSDLNTEVDNLALLTALTDQHGKEKGWQIFNQLKWTVDPKALTTVPFENGSYSVGQSAGDSAPMYALPRFDGTPPMLERLAQSPLDRGLLGLEPAENRAAMLAQIEAIGLAGTPGFQTTSNIWIVGKDKARGAKSILLNGPQFGYFAPAYTYGIGLHGAGYDIVGNTPFAYPCVLFGHNGRVAWGSTAGLGDGVDIYAEKLDPKDPTRYLHNGQWKAMEKRGEIIRVKGSTPVVMDVYRTVHGLVTKVDAKAGVAYAKARSWDGFEVQSLMAWTHKGQAQNWEQWKKQAARDALTINWYYSDREGNIGYAHTGYYPKRRPGHDARLPVPGTGEMDWLGVLPFSTNPQVYNPRQGYILNWNNSPMKGYPATDAWAVLWTQADRAAEIEQRLKPMLENGGRIDADGMWGLLPVTSFADVNRRHFLPFLQSAVKALPADDERAQMVARIARWNGLNTDEDRNGFYDATGGAELDAWLVAMLKATFADDLPADFLKWYAATGYPTPKTPNAGSVNISAGAKALFNVLDGQAAGVPQRYDFLNGKPQGEVILAALGQAAADLKQRYGAEPASWKLPVAPLAFSANNFFGVPQAAPGQARSVAVTMNRGTENDMIAFTSDGVRAVDVVAPGQSGFAPPDGAASPHLNDQFDLYVNFGSKPLWHDKAEVQSHTQTTTRLRY